MWEEELTADSSQPTATGLKEKQIPRFARNDKLFELAGTRTICVLFTPKGAMNRAPTRSWEEFVFGKVAPGIGLGTAFSRVVDEVRGEVEDALESVEGDVVVGLGLADFGGQDEAEFSGARFLIGVHGGD